MSDDRLIAALEALGPEVEAQWMEESDDFLATLRATLGVLDVPDVVDEVRAVAVGAVCQGHPTAGAWAAWWITLLERRQFNEIAARYDHMTAMPRDQLHSKDDQQHPAGDDE